MIARATRGWARLARSLSARASELEAFVLPQRCPGCGDPAGAERLLCDACRGGIPRVEEPLCVRCLARERSPVGCRSHSGFRAWAGWVYEERMACVLHELKFGMRSGLGRAYGEALAETLPIHYRPDLVLEVPLHPARLRERGYNQAELLADALSARLGSPRLAGALRRVRPTVPQTGLGARARRRNLEGAFVADRPAILRNREILIVDDVLTTGCTLEACLEVLRDCGARATGVALAWAS
jgi:ComF family protein